MHQCQCDCGHSRAKQFDIRTAAASIDRTAHRCSCFYSSTCTAFYCYASISLELPITLFVLLMERMGRKRSAAGQISTTVAKALSCGTEMFIRRRILKVSQPSQAFSKLSTLLSEEFEMKLLSGQPFSSKFIRAAETGSGIVPIVQLFMK